MKSLPYHVSVVITVLNEAHNLPPLFQALENQTFQPHEVVFVDGGSVDNTVQLIKVWSEKPHFRVTVFSQPLNRSAGRNFGIAHAKNEWIAITDAGCVPHKNWLHQLKIPILDKQPMNSSYQVVSGYYDALPKTAFQAAMVPYVLVMPDKVDPKTFVPSTRSVLFHKQIWEMSGKFDESLEVSEDLEFFRRIRKNFPEVKFIFASKAKVSWIPRTTFRQFAHMIHNFAMGDVKAGIYRPKVGLLFLRYVIGLCFILGLWSMGISNRVIFGLVMIFLVVYSGWAIQKNKKYVPHGWYWLPILQMSADLIVMWGTAEGLGKKIYRS